MSVARPSNRWCPGAWVDERDIGVCDGQPTVDFDPFGDADDESATMAVVLSVVSESAALPREISYEIDIFGIIGLEGAITSGRTGD
jgi:hypothetical protein